MKLYNWGPAPNPRRVRMFAAEKGIDLTIEEVGHRAELKPEFLQKSSHRLTPLLELDDGTLIGEAGAICRYLEALHPEPRLLGGDPKQAAIIDMWDRKCEFEGLHAVAEVFRNAFPLFENRALGGYEVPIPQIPALVERGTIRVQQFWKKLDARLAGAAFVAGDAFSMADITALCTVDFARVARVDLPAQYQHLQRWHEQVSARPSAKV